MSRNAEPAAATTVGLLLLLLLLLLLAVDAITPKKLSSTALPLLLLHCERREFAEPAGFDASNVGDDGGPAAAAVDVVNVDGAVASFAAVAVAVVVVVVLDGNGFASNMGNMSP